MRCFEKLSFEQFEKDTSLSIDEYNKIKLPKRSTISSAGYDIYALTDFVIHPNEIMKIPTGIKVSMNDGDVMMLFVRSSMGFKYNVRLCNQVGIFESDYYNNPSNEGHIWVKLQNEGTTDYVVKCGDAIGQCVFTKFLTVDDEEPPTEIRTGGIGSTNKEEK